MGNLQSGNTGNVDVMLTGIAATMDDGTIKMEISYEDDAGNVTTTEKTITLFVSEEFFDDAMMDGDMMMGDDMMMEDGKKSKKGLIIGIICVVFIVAGVGTGAFLQIRKKKKAAKMLAEELADLEDEIGKE